MTTGTTWQRTWRNALRRDVRDGLQQTPKTLPPKWFYDAIGSDLFDQITRLPEYYPTRTEAVDPAGPRRRHRGGLRRRHPRRAGQRHLGEDRGCCSTPCGTVERCGASSRSTSIPACCATRRPRCTRVPRCRDRRGVRRLRAGSRHHPASSAGGMVVFLGLHHRQPDPRAARRIPCRACRLPCSREIRCCWAPTWSRTSAGWCAPTTTAPG